MSKKRAVWAELDGGRIRQNLQTVREGLARGTRVCAVLKGNAYGHGLREMGAFLAENRLADLAAVANPAEAEALEQLPAWDGSDLDVLILGYTDAEEAEDAIRSGRILPERTLFSACSATHFRELDQLGRRLGVRLRVHLRLDGSDSGIGIGYGMYRKSERGFFAAEGVEILGLYGHLYTAYSGDRAATEREIRDFDALVREIPSSVRERLTVHLLSSGAVFSFPEYAYDMVRVGTALYGLGERECSRLRPVMRICGRICAVREVGPEVPLSYGAGGAGNGTRRVAQVMLGYGDCPCLLTQGRVLAEIRGQLYPLADEPFMDHLCLDVTGAEGVRSGDTAVLLGPDGITACEIAQRSGISYVHGDWMTMTADRLEKVIVNA